MKMQDMTPGMVFVYDFPVPRRKQTIVTIVAIVTDQTRELWRDVTIAVIRDPPLSIDISTIKMIIDADYYGERWILVK